MDSVLPTIGRRPTSPEALRRITDGEEA